MSNHTILIFYRSALTLLAAALLSGCAAAVVGGSAVAVHDRRTIGQVFDDQNIEYSVVRAIYASDDIGEESHIKVEVYENVVLLMGETDNEDRKRKAGEVAAAVEHVERVVNEIQTHPRASFGDRVNNSWLTAKVDTALMRENPVPGFDATRIKAISSDGTVYLMGLVTREEGNAVAEVVRNVSGVDKVVKVFDYVE